MDCIGTLFIEHALEILDTQEENYYEHFLIKPLVKNPEYRRHIIRYKGSIVCNHNMIVSLKLHSDLNDHMIQTIKDL